MTVNDFQYLIKQGIPEVLPEAQAYDLNTNHAPVRKDVFLCD